MILTCPECATSYTTPDGVIGAEGRNVKCRKCAHVWLARETGLAASGEDLQIPPESRPVNDEESASASESEEFERKAERDEDPVQPTAEEPDQKDIITAYETIYQESGERGIPDKTPEKRHFAALFSHIAAIAAILTLVAGSALLFRTSVVSALPGAAKLYAVLGYPVNLRGLEFRNVTFERSFEDGLPVLAIYGEIVNITQKRRPLPRLRFALRDNFGQEVYYWSGAIGEESLAPGQTIPFTTRLASPPVTAQNIMVRFTGYSPG